MRRYDRYFLWVFAQSALLMTALVATAFVVVDVLLNLDEFQQFENIARDVTLYYAFNLPPILYLLLPIVVAGSGLFALARIVRARELIVLQAAGVSPRRALAAIFAGTLAIGVGGMALREYVLPPLNQAQRASPAGAFEFRKGKRITVRDDAGNAWYVRSYDLRKNKFSGVRILSRDGNTLVVAEELNWVESRGQWFTPAGKVHDLGALLSGTQAPPSPAAFSGQPPIGQMLPTDFARRKRGFAGTPISELWHDSDARPDFPELSVAAHHELWHPFGGVLMLVVAAGLALWRNLRPVFASALAVCALMAYQVGVFWFETLAMAGVFSAAAGTALTPLTFAVAAAILWARK